MFKPLRKVVRKLGQQQHSGLSPSKTPAGHSAQTSEQSLPISTDIRENERYFKQVIGESPDLNVHKFQCRFKEKKVEALLVYISGLEDADSIHENVLDPLRKYADHPGADQPILAELRARINHSDIQEETDLNRCIEAILGDYRAVLIVNGIQTALLINVPGAENRGLEEPASEAAVRGPRIGFIESVYENMALIRRRIRHPSLRFEFFELGRLTKTKVVLGYVSGISQPEMIDQARQRLQQIHVDSINSSGDVEQYIDDHPYSIFPTISNTERPDRAAAQLLEGHIIILVDGDPIGLVAPYIFMESFQSVEDYSSRPYYASFVRFLRITAFVLSITFPALFIAALNFHKETIPSELIVSMTATREIVPFPVPMETFIMIILFEVVREAGIRMPRPIGQAVSIVGALILGDVSVSAGLVGAPTIIVVAFSTIASFAITRIADVMAILRIALLIPASLLGAYGLLIALLGLLTHMLSLKSFGVPYLAPIAPLHLRDWGDTFIRLPAHWLRNRPQSIPNLKKERIKRLPIDHKEDQP